MSLEVLKSAGPQVFDWDDTLLPTTWLERRRVRLVRPQIPHRQRRWGCSRARGDVGEARRVAGNVRRLVFVGDEGQGEGAARQPLAPHVGARALLSLWIVGQITANDPLTCAHR